MFKRLSRFLAVLTLLPVIILVIFMMYSSISSIAGYADSSATANRAEVVKEFNNLVHQVQLERGLTAAFLGSSTDEFASRLTIQRKSGDNQWEKVMSLQSIIDKEPFMQETFTQIKAQWSNIQTYRNNIDKRAISLGDALSFYTGINKIILDNNYQVARMIKSSALSSQMSVVANISYLKEYAGIERAVLSNGFAKNDFSIGLYTRFISLITTQGVFLGNAKNFANPDLLKRLNTFANGDATQQVNRFRDLARNSQASAPNADAAEWFAAATKRIEQAKELESSLLEEIENIALSGKTTNQLTTIGLILLSLFIILLAAFIFVSMRRRQTQANLILSSTAKLKDNHDISQPIPIVIEDNIGAIATALNEAFKQLSNDILEFQQSAVEIASAAEQASQSTNKSNENLNRQTSAVVKLKQFTDSVNISINSDLNDIKLANDAALEAKKQASEGSMHVAETVKSIQTSAKSLHSVGESVHNLNDRVKDIEGMVEMIRSVAEQTNLLALNAAIEAARAGEQGRGFAVVADEVRSLAQRTQENTQKIADIVEELTRSSDDANKTIDTSVDEINLCVEKSESITSVLEQVGQGMNELEAMMTTVNQSAVSQASQIESMNLQVDNIREAAEENSADAELMASTSVQLSSVASSMKTRTDAYKLS